jgi:hypothetical protein
MRITFFDAAYDGELERLLVGRALQAAPGDHLRHGRRQEARHEVRTLALDDVVLHAADQEDQQADRGCDRRNGVRQHHARSHERRGERERDQAPALGEVGLAAKHQQAGEEREFRNFSTRMRGKAKAIRQ